MIDLTFRQTEVLGFIKKFCRENKYSPSIREIAGNFKMTERGAYDHVRALLKKKAISMTPKISRSIVVLDTPDSELFKID